jgi:dipeptidyl aminopeptidase/acylaminoacyl peptidase
MWISYSLAGRGYIVAALNHHGNTGVGETHFMMR